MNVRSRAEILRFFDGFELVDPGLAYVSQWRPDPPGDTGPFHWGELVGVARKDVMQRGTAIRDDVPVQAAWRQFPGPSQGRPARCPPGRDSRVAVTGRCQPRRLESRSPAAPGRELARDWSASVPVSPLRDQDAGIDLHPYREDLELVIARSLSEAWPLASVKTPPPGP